MLETSILRSKELSKFSLSCLRLGEDHNSVLVPHPETVNEVLLWLVLHAKHCNEIALRAQYVRDVAQAVQIPVKCESNTVLPR